MKKARWNPSLWSGALAYRSEPQKTVQGCGPLAESQSTGLPARLLWLDWRLDPVMKPGKQLLGCFHQMRLFSFVPDGKFRLFPADPHRLLVLVIDGQGDYVHCGLGSGRLLFLAATIKATLAASGFLVVFILRT